MGWGGVWRWKNQDGAMPDGSSEMVRVVNCLEGEPEEAQSGMTDLVVQKAVQTLEGR